MGLFSNFRSRLVEIAETENEGWLEFPLRRLGSIISEYNRGDFIVVSGRKTSGRGYFLLYNYVVSPIMQYVAAKKRKQTIPLKIIYINTRHSFKTIMERMILNYISSVKKGNKFSIYSLYNLAGKGILRVSRKYAVSAINKSTAIFEKLSENGILNVFSGTRYVDELEGLISSVLVDYGEYDVDKGMFIYKEEFEDLVPIVVIDDTTNIYDANGKSVMKYDGGTTLATTLKTIAKSYNILIVLSMPSVPQRLKAAVPTIAEAEPFGIYADRCLILHNPAETREVNPLNHDINDFINEGTGICYFRKLYVAANYMGPSGINMGLFVYPENGYYEELPKADSDDQEDVEALDDYIALVKDYRRAVTTAVTNDEESEEDDEEDDD